MLAACSPAARATVTCSLALARSEINPSRCNSISATRPWAATSSPDACSDSAAIASRASRNSPHSASFCVLPSWTAAAQSCRNTCNPSSESCSVTVSASISDLNFWTVESDPLFPSTAWMAWRVGFLPVALRESMAFATSCLVMMAFMVFCVNWIVYRNLLFMIYGISYFLSMVFSKLLKNFTYRHPA